MPAAQLGFAVSHAPLPEAIPDAEQKGVEKPPKNKGLVAITHSCTFLPPRPREGKELTRTTATYAKAKATSAPTTTMKSRMFQRSRK